MKYKFLFVLFIGLAIRFILIGNTGFKADISFWKSWSLAAIDHGIVWTTENTNINYPPGFIYVLWFMGKFYSIAANPHNYESFWRENNFWFLFVSKSVAIASDVIIACLIYWFASQKEKLKELGAEISSKFKIQSARQPAGGRTKVQVKSKNEIAGDASEGFPDVASPALSPNDSWAILKQRLGYASGRTRSISVEKFVSEELPDNTPLLLSSVFFLNPIVILDSALWGQVESFGILFTLVAMILLYYKRPLLATAIFTTGALMKLQNIIFIPLYFIFILRYFNRKIFLKSLSVAGASFFAVNLPFILANKMDKVLFLLTINSDYFPWLSLNAHNLWWIVAHAKGMQILDRITFLGILNAKTVGLMIFSSCYLLCLTLLFKKPTPRNFILSFIIGIFSFFLFTTQSHERYSYPVVVLLLFLYPFIYNNDKKSFAISSKIRAVELDFVAKLRKGKRELTERSEGIPEGLPEQFGNTKSFQEPILREMQKSNNIYFWVLYILLTLTIFFNMHFGLVINYPLNGLYFLSRITTSNLTIVNSYFLIILFFLLLPFVLTQISKLWLVVSCGLLVVALFALNLSYLISGKVYLTSFKPIIAKQDFASLQVNKTVNSYNGWKSWNRLSNNYFYYRKGFGTHANSNLVFDLDRKFNTFETDFGIDTEAGTSASVDFQIFGDDGKELFKSGKMGRFDFPGHAKVDVAGVKYLGLTVNARGNGINDDHADWLNPVLYR